MQERKLYEYAVIRLVPRVEREEFLNIGVILYCAKESFLDCIFIKEHQQISPFLPYVDLPFIEKNLQSISLICKGNQIEGSIANEMIATRFRWLTAQRSTQIQCSKVHPGLCKNASDKLQQLFNELVL